MTSAGSNVSFKLKELLSGYTLSPTLSELLPKLGSVLPIGVDFESDTWELISWLTRPGNSETFPIYYYDIKNSDLRKCLKVFTLHKRLTKTVGGRAAHMYLDTCKFLDKVILGKDISKLRNVDFYNAEILIKKSCERTAPKRFADMLEEFGAWLNWQLGISISYEAGLPSVYMHGRKASEEGRQEKLMSTEVIRDMVAANNNTDNSDKDRFFLSAFVILIATGFRINELATMPKDCLLQNNGNTSLRFFPEKDGKLGTRFIASDMEPSVVTALDHIILITEPGRAAVAEIRRSLPPNWSAILNNQAATDYFVGRFAHNWAADPLHKMINTEGAWLEKQQRFVDVIELVKSAGSKSAAARELGVTRKTIAGLLIAQTNAHEGLLPGPIETGGKGVRTSWDTDTRVISLQRFRLHCGIMLQTPKPASYRHILDEAQRLQLAGQVYPCPVLDKDFEAKFERKIRAVIMDKEGKSRLEPEDALFVIPRYGFSTWHSTKDEDYRLITDNGFSRWLRGETRSQGSGNHEDSCFNRLGIVDPKTGEIAKYTSHDVRHWLDTIYAEGMMDEDTVGVVFGRKKGSNHTYDQTSKKQRLENLRQAVRDGSVFGHITDAYVRLASQSREEAEQFLMAYTLMINIMPHGACTLNWGLDPCPHHLGCFTKDGDKKGPCEHFCVDKSDPVEIEELKRIAREVEVTLRNLPEESPQYDHYNGIGENLAILLENC